MWTEILQSPYGIAAALIGLVPLGLFGNALFRAGAPNPDDGNPSRYDWLFPLKGRWRRLFFLGVQFAYFGPIVYLGGVFVSLIFMALLVAVVTSVLAAFGVGL